ncbi:MAG: 4-hydroxy-3-methylbut-2-enyl diphosphate reductase, partial [Erysipelotrichia bacterium]|nr:4-hydroxy-3-methylbut-2-enyl diphosphate reductase [Erysipelotrichia bacterium]
MEIIKVKPSGYCKGVIKAILKVKETLKKYPNKQIYILGMLVHNRFVVQALEQYHIITLNDRKKTKKELIDEINEGVIIFTAHGIDPQLKKYAQNKGLITVDATCDDVT